MQWLSQVIDAWLDANHRQIKRGSDILARIEDYEDDDWMRKLDTFTNPTENAIETVL
jgi:predicted nucleotidyltransferase